MLPGECGSLLLHAVHQRLGNQKPEPPVWYWQPCPHLGLLTETGCAGKRELLLNVVDGLRDVPGSQ